MYIRTPREDIFGPYTYLVHACMAFVEGLFLYMHKLGPGPYIVVDAWPFFKL